jgi:hypothetical protein
MLLYALYIYIHFCVDFIHIAFQIIWDGASMLYQHCFEVVSYTLEDYWDDHCSYGGIIDVFSGYY